MNLHPFLSSLLSGMNLSDLEARVAASPVDPEQMRVYESSPNDWYLQDGAGASWAHIYDPALAALLAHAPEDLALLVANIQAIQKELNQEEALEEYLFSSDPDEFRDRYTFPLTEEDLDTINKAVDPQAEADRIGDEYEMQRIREKYKRWSALWLLGKANMMELQIAKMQRELQVLKEMHEEKSGKQENRIQG